MGIKPGKVFRHPKNRSYTRKEYMGGTPGSKITIFDMGDLQKGEGFEVRLSLVAKEASQITHNALEAARIASNRHLINSAGKTGFHLKFRLYPHEILRENKQASGAGADRVSDGMRRSFGKAIALGAKVQRDQRIITASVSAAHYVAAKGALQRAGAKLPVPTRLVVEKGAGLLKL